MEEDINKGDSEESIREYNRGEVISLAKKSNEIHFVDRTIENMLDNIIEFLISKRAQKVLEWNSEHMRGDYFLNEEMNIRHDRDTSGKRSYSYNTITAITLALLLRLYEESYFKSLIKNKYAYVEKGEIWFEKAENEIHIFKDDWCKYKDEKDEQSWDIISINILSQLHKLTLPKINLNIIEGLEEEMQEEMQNITDKFLAMGDDSKNKTYKKIKTKLKSIDKQMEDVIENMNEAERSEFNANLQFKNFEMPFFNNISKKK